MTSVPAWAAVFIVATAAPTQPRNGSDNFSPGGRRGVHGMVVFGTPGGPVYLSHIPMFHAPHDVQLLLEVSFEPRRAVFTAEGKPRTLLPEPFSLDDVILGTKRQLRGTVYGGNFESGGKPLGRVTVHVRRVLEAQVLRPDAAAASALEYLVLDAGQAAFLVHVIRGSPGFDQILAAAFDPAAETNAPRVGLAHLALPDRASSPDTRLLAAPGRVHALLEGHPVQLRVLSELSALGGPDFSMPLPRPGPPP